MTQVQARDMLPADPGGEAPDFLFTIDPKTAHSHLLYLLQSGDIIRYYEDNPADRDALEAAIQESTRPMLQPTPVTNPCNSDIAGNAVSVASQYPVQEHENGPGHTSQDRPS